MAATPGALLPLEHLDYSAESSVDAKSPPTKTSASASQKLFKEDSPIDVQQVQVLKIDWEPLLGKDKFPDVSALIGKRLSPQELDCLAEAISGDFRRDGIKVSAKLRPLDYTKGKLGLILRPQPSVSQQADSVKILNFCLQGLALSDQSFAEIPEFQESLGTTLSTAQLNQIATKIDTFYQTKGIKTQTTMLVANATKGIITLDIQKSKPPTTTKPALSTPINKAVAVPSNAPFIVKSVQFQGNHSISTESLMALPKVNSVLGKTIQAQDLEDLGLAVTDLYRSEGLMLAQSSVRKKENGIIDITVYEGFIDQVNINNTSTLDSLTVKQMLLNQLCGDVNDCQGFPLIDSRSERALGILSDLPGVANPKLRLSPGTKVATTNIDLSLAPGDTYTGYFSGDNYGGTYTGKNRYKLGMVINSPFNIGDQLVLEANGTKISGNSTGQIGYSLPLGLSGGRVGASLSRIQYYLGEELKSLSSKGFSNSLSLWGSYPLIREQQNNLSTRVSLDYGKPKSEINGSTLAEATITAINAAISGRITDTLLGRSFSNYGLVLRRSNVKDEINTTKATSSSTKVQWNASRDQSLFDIGQGRFSLYANFRGQHANDTLDASEKYSLGGPSGVRAYPAGEGVGDIGYIGTAELRYGLYLAPLVNGFLTTAIFYDRGTRQEAKALANKPNDYNKLTIYGSGLSMTLSIQDQYTLKAEWAKRDKKSPLPTYETPTKDSRLWITGGYTW